MDEMVLWKQTINVQIKASSLFSNKTQFSTLNTSHSNIYLTIFPFKDKVR